MEEELLQKGLRVIIVTNSLASTNHVAVHSGYARYRKQLLRAGAEMYEIRADFIGKDTDWVNRAHFFHAAARAMHDILIEQARRHGTLKRGGRKPKTPASSETRSRYAIGSPSVAW